MPLFAGLPDYSRRSLAWHVPAVVLDGLVQGVAVLFLIVARKTLLASDAVVTILTIGPVGVMVFGNVLGVAMLGRSKRAFLVAAGLVGRLPLLLVFFVTDVRIYAAILVFSFFYYILFKPAENSIIQANYDKEQRGRIYGWLNSLMLLCAMAGAWAGGRILDASHDNYRYLIPAAGVLGFAAMMLYAFLPVRVMDYDAPRAVAKGVLAAYRNFFESLLKDAPFGRLELSFLIYGFGIIMLDPLLIIFVVDDLKLDYSAAAVAMGLIGQLAILALSPFVGRLFDRVRPGAMLGASVLLLIAFPIMLFFAHGTALLYAAYVVRGVAMSGILMVWNLGPIHYAEERDSTNYMGVHLTLTGVRGLFAPLLGMGTYYLLGIRGAFLVSAAIFVVAGVMSLAFARMEGTAG
ncbi:MAG: MFS transporter [Deltaproteobacteria bacterium]|nr:MFS transporter [Deltaproteobacteria bacterium]